MAYPTYKYWQPTDLDIGLGLLRGDRDRLKVVADRITVEVEAIKMAGPRADRLRERLRYRALEADKRAEAIDELVTGTSSLRQTLEDEAAYLDAISLEADLFFRRLEQQVNRTWDAYQLTLGERPTEEAPPAPLDPATLYNGWRWAPGRIPPSRSQEWHDANIYLHRRSGVAGITYDGPAPQ